MIILINKKTCFDKCLKTCLKIKNQKKHEKNFFAKKNAFKKKIKKIYKIITEMKKKKNIEIKQLFKQINTIILSNEKNNIITFIIYTLLKYKFNCLKTSIDEIIKCKK